MTPSLNFSHIIEQAPTGSSTQAFNQPNHTGGFHPDEGERLEEQEKPLGTGFLTVYSPFLDKDVQSKDSKTLVETTV